MEREEKIAAYLNQQLPEAVTAAFEQELAEDEELARDLELARFERATIKYMMEKELLEQMRSYRPTENSARIRRLLPSIAIAASIALLLGFFAINIFNSSNSKLVAVNLEEVAPIYVHERSIRSSANESTRFEAGKIAILEEKRAEQAQEAIDYFSSFEANQALYPQAQFNLAHACLLNGEPEAAIPLFQNILDGKEFNSELKQASLYYKAVAHLANAQTKEAKNILNDISTSNTHLYQDYAKQLLDQLDTFWRRFYF